MDPLEVLATDQDTLDPQAPQVPLVLMAAMGLRPHTLGGHLPDEVDLGMVEEEGKNCLLSITVLIVLSGGRRFLLPKLALYQAFKKRFF